MILLFLAEYTCTNEYFIRKRFRYISGCCQKFGVGEVISVFWFMFILSPQILSREVKMGWLPVLQTRLRFE